MSVFPLLCVLCHYPMLFSSNGALITVPNPVLLPCSILLSLTSRALSVCSLDGFGK